jgi:protein-disulfide isomerase
LQAVEYILQLLSGKGTAYKRQVLDDWYLQMDLKEFSEKYMLIGKKNTDWQLEKHEKWVKETGISFTPTIFINGNQLPRQYVASDVKLLLRGFQRKKAETKKTMF